MTWCGPGRVLSVRASRRLAFIAVLTTTLLYSGVRHADAAPVIGGSAADFLQFEVGGRSAGMGGAHAGVASGVTSQFWNPALLGSLQDPEIGALHASWLGDLSYEWVGYARPLGPRLGVGSASVAYFHMPTIQGVDEYNNPTEPFRVYDLALTLGFARQVVHGVQFGVNGKVIRQSLASVSATGMAADAGIAANVLGSTIGLAVVNLGPSMSYSDAATYPLPRVIRFGASRGFLQDKLLVAADYNSPANYYDDIRIGTEFKAHRFVSIRLGYRYELQHADDPVTGLSYGLGLHFGPIKADYAMTPSDDFDNVQRFALGYSFGGGEEEKPEKQEKPKKEKPLPPKPPKQPTTVSVAPKAKQAPKQKAAEPVTVLVDSKALAAAHDAAPPASKSAQQTDTQAPAKAAPQATTQQAPQTQAANPPAKSANDSAQPVVIASRESNDASSQAPPAQTPVPSAPPVKETKGDQEARATKELAEATDDSDAKDQKDQKDEKNAKKEQKEQKQPKPEKVTYEHAVVLVGYATTQSAQAELKALQLLGFRTKDATVSADPNGGYTIHLAQMKSKNSADDMVSSLARMSFRAVVQTVQR